jgi:inhibitor of cysteine peptidase
MKNFFSRGLKGISISDYAAVIVRFIRTIHNKNSTKFDFSHTCVGVLQSVIRINRVRATTSIGAVYRSALNVILLGMMISGIAVAEKVSQPGDTLNQVPTVAHGTISQEANDKPLMVHSDQKNVTIRLGANPTTGFSWFLLGEGGALFKPVSHHFIAAKKGDKPWVGASGVEEWTFRILPEAFKVPTVIHIRLMYARPFELHTGSVRQITLVTVP